MGRLLIAPNIDNKNLLRKMKRKFNRELIVQGYEIMKHLNVAICSIVRNCNMRLMNNIPAVEHIRKLFNESIVIIFENDSIDGTKETLKN